MTGASHTRSLVKNYISVSNLVKENLCPIPIFSAHLSQIPRAHLFLIFSLFFPCLSLCNQLLMCFWSVFLSHARILGVRPREEPLFVEAFFSLLSLTEKPSQGIKPLPTLVRNSAFPSLMSSACFTQIGNPCVPFLLSFSGKFQMCVADKEGAKCPISPVNIALVNCHCPMRKRR